MQSRGQTAWDVVRWDIIAIVLARSLALAGAFFASAWVIMAVWGAAAPSGGLTSIGYGTAILVTAGIWAAVSPICWLIAYRVKRGSVIEI